MTEYNPEVEGVREESAELNTIYLHGRSGEKIEHVLDRAFGEHVAKSKAGLDAHRAQWEADWSQIASDLVDDADLRRFALSHAVAGRNRYKGQSPNGFGGPQYDFMTAEAVIAEAETFLAFLKGGGK
jgi:hypothetical protein